MCQATHEIEPLFAQVHQLGQTCLVGAPLGHLRISHRHRVEVVVGQQDETEARGGSRPAWGRNGRELFYIDAAATLTAVPLSTSGSTFSAGTPAPVFATKYATLVNVRNYDVSADGRRFLMIKEDKASEQPAPANLVVVLNWFEELKARVPQK